MSASANLDATLRPAEAADLPAIHRLHNECEAFDKVPRVLSFNELVEELDDDHVKLATDTRVAVRSGAIVGYAYTYYVPSETKEERCFLFGQVSPDHRRTGVGTALTTWSIDRATEQLNSSNRDLPRYIRTETDEVIPSAIALFETLGMTPVRYNDILLRPLDELPTATTLDGVTIVPWPTERNEEIRQAKNTAFIDHWGSTPSPAKAWEQDVHGSTSRPDLSFVALDDDGNVVGHCLNNRYESDDELLGRKEGWIMNLGSLREFRGRGVASAMIAHSLHAFREVGLTHAAIEVDSENPTGAARLYRSLGFVATHRSITHQIAL